MESLRKFLKNKKKVEIFLTTEENIYEGKGAEILKQLSDNELEERVYSENRDLMSGVLEVFSYTYDKD